MFATSDGGRERGAVAHEELEAVEQPVPPRHERAHTMHEAVRHVVEAVVNRDVQHAHVERDAAPMVARDQLRLWTVEVLEALHGVAMVAHPESPVREPDRQLQVHLCERFAPPT